jgi:hypothetical protein
MYEEVYDALGFIAPEPIQVAVTTMAGETISIRCFKNIKIGALKLKLEEQGMGAPIRQSLYTSGLEEAHADTDLVFRRGEVGLDIALSLVKLPMTVPEIVADIVAAGQLAYEAASSNLPSAPVKMKNAIDTILAIMEEFDCHPEVTHKAVEQLAKETCSSDIKCNALRESGAVSVLTPILHTDPMDAAAATAVLEEATWADDSSDQDETEELSVEEQERLEEELQGNGRYSDLDSATGRQIKLHENEHKAKASVAMIFANMLCNGHKLSNCDAIYQADGIPALISTLRVGFTDVYLANALGGGGMGVGGDGPAAQQARRGRRRQQYNIVDDGFRRGLNGSRSREREGGYSS